MRMRYVLSSSRGRKHTVHSHNSFSHPAQRHMQGWFELKVITYLGEFSICAHTYRREWLDDAVFHTQSQILRLMSHRTLKLKNSLQITVSERKETFGIYVFLYCFIKFMQRGTCCPGLCLNIVMAAKHISSRQISLRDFVLPSRHSLPGRWTSCHI